MAVLAALLVMACGKQEEPAKAQKPAAEKRATAEQKAPKEKKAAEQKKVAEEKKADAAYAQDNIVHDAEYYILEAQNGEKWASEDKALDQKLAELRKKYGRPPNIIHIMWDDTAFGDVGIPAIQKVRGFETPHLNKMAEGGMIFTRMYTEVGCTPSRAASATGRLAIRSGMYNIGMLLEMHGMRGEEVTIAEVLSKAGYATAFHGKWHLGDIEESYPHNQGFDEAFFTGYNQILSLNTRKAEGANASIGLHEDMLPPDPYKLDNTFVTKGWVQVAEGKKGEKARQWGDNSHENYLKIDAEAQRRTMPKPVNPFMSPTGPTWRVFSPTRRSVRWRAASCRMACSAILTPSSAKSWRSSRNWGSPRIPWSSPWRTTGPCPTTHHLGSAWPKPSSVAARVTSSKVASVCRPRPGGRA